MAKRMQLTIRLMGLNLLPHAEKIVLNIKPASTVEQALQEFIASTEQAWSVEELMRYVMLVNNRRVYGDYVLADKDTLTILRTMEGG